MVGKLQSQPTDAILCDLGQKQCSSDKAQRLDHMLCVVLGALLHTALSVAAPSGG